MPSGPGIVFDTIAVLPAFALIVAAFGVLALVVALLWIKPRGWRAAVAITGLVVLVAGATLYLAPPPEFGNAQSITPTAPDAVASDQDSYILTLGPQQSFVAYFDITNDGLLPLRIDGAVGYQAVPRTFPDWQSVAYELEAGSITMPSEQLQPFIPFDLGPGQSAQLGVTGRTDACASAAPDSGAFESIDYVAIAYSLLGIPATTEVKLPHGIVQTLNEDCHLAWR